MESRFKKLKKSSWVPPTANGEIIFLKKRKKSSQGKRLQHTWRQQE